MRVRRHDVAVASVAGVLAEPAMAAWVVVSQPAAPVGVALAVAPQLAEPVVAVHALVAAVSQLVEPTEAVARPVRRVPAARRAAPASALAALAP